MLTINSTMPLMPKPRCSSDQTHAGLRTGDRKWLNGSESMVSDYAAKWRTGENAGEPIVNATNRGTNTFMSIRESLEVSSNIAATNIFQDLWERGDHFCLHKLFTKWAIPKIIAGRMNQHHWGYRCHSLESNEWLPNICQ